MENETSPKPYSTQWFLQELTKAMFIAIIFFLLQIAGTGIIQAYLLPNRMDQEAEKMQKKFDDQIKAAHNDSVNRESELIQQIEEMRKQYAELLRKSNPSAPESNVDPEKRRLLYIQKHSKF